MNRIRQEYPRHAAFAGYNFLILRKSIITNENYSQLLLSVYTASMVAVWRQVTLTTVITSLKSSVTVRKLSMAMIVHICSNSCYSLMQPSKKWLKWYMAVVFIYCMYLISEVKTWTKQWSTMCHEWTHGTVCHLLRVTTLSSFNILKQKQCHFLHSNSNEPHLVPLLHVCDFGAVCKYPNLLTYLLRESEHKLRLSFLPIE